MADPQGTSFIPQRSTKKKASPVGIRKIYFLSYISYVLFFCTLIVTAGIFFYQYTLDAQLENAKQKLVQERSSFNQSDIERIRELDFRIDTALERLDDHISVYSLFTAFENTTVASVRFLDFSYQRLIGGIPYVSVLAYAESFDNVLFQREVLKSNPVLAGMVISDSSLQGAQLQNAIGQYRTESVVSFVMGAELPKESVRYTAPAVSVQNQTNTTASTTASQQQTESTQQESATSSDAVEVEESSQESL